MNFFFDYDFVWETTIKGASHINFFFSVKNSEKIYCTEKFFSPKQNFFSHLWFYKTIDSLKNRREKTVELGYNEAEGNKKK